MRYRRGSLVLAFSMCLALKAIAGDLRLQLLQGDFSPNKTALLAPSWFHPGADYFISISGFLYRTIISQRALEPNERAEMERAGIEFLSYLPGHGYNVRMAAGTDEEVTRRLAVIGWSGKLPPYFKVAPSLSKQVQTGQDARIRILFYAGETAKRLLDLLPSVEQEAPGGKGGAWRVVATLPGAQAANLLSAIVSLPEVEAVEEVKPFRLFNQDAVWVHQSFVGPTAQQTPIFDHGIYGCGQTVALADTGQDYGACYFRDTVNGFPPFYNCTTVPCPVGATASRRKDIVYYNWSGTPTGDDDTCPATTGASGHGTHVSGSIAGDNLTYANCSTFTTPGRTGGDGQAPGAKLVVEEMGDGLEYLNNFNGTVWNLADVAYQNGARIHSNSWGTACFDQFGNCIPGCTIPYDSYARDADLAMWTYPDLLMLFAAGNAAPYCPAPDSVGSPGIAKNIVTVGSVGHGTNANTASSFSSPGPVFDGRLKPSVAAQGESVVSARSDANPTNSNCSTCSLAGTSMATPTTAGLSALIREYFTAGFYTTGARNAGQGFTPTGALIKAVLINGAVALSAPPSPNFASGYGRVLLGQTLAFTGSSFQLRVDDHREGITTGSIVNHAYDVSAGTNFTVSLVWTDYPAALNAAVARVNELKLEVIDPSGNIWFQKINGAGLPVQTMNAVDVHDNRNVEERISFAAPAAGRWIVRVRGIDVPWGPQPFALVVRGSLVDCPATAAPTNVILTTPADHQVQVSWSAVSGAARYNVYRSYGACPAAPWTPVATALAGTSFLDSTVSGGVTYSYYVVATSDAAGFCESPRSSCASVVPTGDCFLAPSFSGAQSANSAAASSCGINVSWNAASPYCPTDVRYNIYRSTSSSFTPSSANRIARCVIGNGYSDSNNLVYGSTYYYVVRAEDAATPHGGSCRNGNEDANSVRVNAAPYGPSVIGNWIDDAGDTDTAKMSVLSPWSVAATGGNAGPKVYRGNSSEGICADLTSPVLGLADPGQGPALAFATKHNLAYDPFGIFGAEGSLGQVEIATAPNFDNWDRVPLSPDYPTQVDFPLNNCPTTANPDSYFSGTNNSFGSYTASLLNWGGTDVRIRFHLSGDYLYPDGSWWIDDLQVMNTLVPSSCTTLATGPPPVPDGAAVPGVPMKADKNGSNVNLTWDAARCAAAAVNVYRGTLGDFSTFTAGSCNLPETGAATLAIPDNSWFLVAASDSATTDGSWARDPNGAERTYSGSAVCAAQHVTNNGCP